MACKDYMGPCSYVHCLAAERNEFPNKTFLPKSCDECYRYSGCADCINPEIEQISVEICKKAHNLDTN